MECPPWSENLHILYLGPPQLICASVLEGLETNMGHMTNPWDAGAYVGFCWSTEYILVTRHCWGHQCCPQDSTLAFYDPHTSFLYSTFLFFAKMSLSMSFPSGRLFL